MNLRRMANLFGRGNFSQENTEVGAKKEDAMVKEVKAPHRRETTCAALGWYKRYPEGKTPPLNTLSCEDPIGLTGRKPTPRGSWKIH